MEEYLDLLNNSQREAVIYNDGPSLVIAGAGSGKTRVLTYKIAGLLQHGYSPSSVLALTFTNKAAKEMKERIAKIVGAEVAGKLWMGTFHSIFYRILRMEADKIGFSSDFSIYDSADSRNLLKTIIKSMKLDDKTYNPNKVHARISQLKNNLVTPQSYEMREDLHASDIHARMPLIKDIYNAYAQRCLKAVAMDFDDLLLYTNILFRDNPGVLAKYQNYFKFILVDEYQDTNFAQHLIIKKLADRHHKVCVVGDDAQSIYSFRGANIENILKFKDTYPECKLFKLEQNYRSTKSIVNAANSLINKNVEQIRKNVFSENRDGTPVKIISAYSDKDESFTVAKLIEKMHNEQNYEYKDFAILYRTNAQSRSIEESLREYERIIIVNGETQKVKGIPYKIYGGVSFFQRKEVKDVLAYLKLIVNHADEEAFKRIINYPTRGIGEMTINKIIESAKAFKVTLWEIVSDPLRYNLSINAGTATKIGNFRTYIEQLSYIEEETNAFELTDRIVKQTGILKELYKDDSTENLTRRQCIEELLGSIHAFCSTKIEEEGIEIPTIKLFLQEVALITDQDDNKNEDTDMVTMMTVHASKGLEFKNVFIVGMEEELFPSSMSTGSPASLEEERRLFYVAITRAEENCIITYAKSRFRNGSQNYCNPSRFIKDIDPSLIELPEDYKNIHGRIASNGISSVFSQRPQTQYSPRINQQPRQSSPGFLGNRQMFQKPLTRINTYEKKENPNSINNVQKNSACGIEVGSFVEHQQYGIGKVITIEGAEGTEKATIEFKNVGIKKMLLKFAKLKPIKAK